MPIVDEDTTSTPTHISDFAQEVFDEIAAFRGAEPSDIKIDAAFADWGVSGPELEDLLKDIANHFDVPYESIKEVNTVLKLIETLEDKDFE
jgi:hypothetical protein